MAWRQLWALALRQALDPGDGLSGFLSRVSIAGLVLAVALLLAVLSVMNGFEREMRERILGVVPHITVRGAADHDTWQSLQTRLASDPEVVTTQSFFDVDALVVRGRDAEAVRLLGLQGSLARYQGMLTPDMASLPAGELLLGAGLAGALGVAEGQRLTLLAPAADSRGASAAPARFTVAGVINTGTELDQRLAIAPRAEVAALAGSAIAINGLALTIVDVFTAPRLRWYIDQQLPAGLYASDWTSTHGNLYAAIRLSRQLILLLMASIIAVAAFNVVSSLVLVVTDRAPAIAMLRAVGAQPRDVVVVYLTQGAVIGGLGAAGGALLGAALASGAPYAAALLSHWLGRPLLSTEVYPIGFLPVSLQIADFVLVAAVTVALCLLAAAIPAWRAARLPVAATLSR